MPDENTNPATVSPASPVAKPVSDAPAPDSVVVEPTAPQTPTVSEPTQAPDVPTEVAHKINEAHNVLIALSSDPSVDEMAAAIGLSLFLDKIGKRATAIYSGTTPNALEFLKPEETFEPTADALQDFVIALNKDKADHLRYKLDGDFVKIYITPYKTRVSEEDLDFSYGDFNVDLVLALDVANGVDLDSALREHGRIMHNASIINITTGNPGKLGEIEWSDKSASSVSEMVAKLLYGMKSKAEIEKEEATAFLTGIVAATNRFSNASTTPETMKISSKLMESGANQQLISENITPDTENEMLNMMPEEAKKEDPTSLDIEHDGEEEPEKPEEPIEAPKEVDTMPSENEPIDEPANEPDLMDDLKAAEASLAQVGDKTVIEQAKEPLKIDSENVNSASVELPQVEKSPEEPSIELGADAFSQEDNSNKYGQMLEDALGNAGLGNGDSVEPTAPIMSPSENPAVAATPNVPTAPEINGVPEINYAPATDEAILPPPPAPPIDMTMPTPSVTVPEAQVASETPATPVAPEPIMPTVSSETPEDEPSVKQPAMQDQVYTPQAADPGAFKIPGM